jgi:NIMA (never in mitosis gene a)-related kinase
MHNFTIIKKLGKGSFAEVYLVQRKIDKQLYALKRVDYSSMSSSDKEHALNEIRLLASFSHPNIISYKECFYTQSSNSLDMIMEYATHGDLSSLIKYHKLNNVPILESTIWKILIQVLFGLNALHNKRIIHRDLKSANIFLCDNNVSKIGDLNVSKRLKYTSYLQSQTGTPYYASPEIWMEKPYDMRTDVWSLGCIGYELCTLNVPFKAKSIKMLSNAIVKGCYKPISEYYSFDLREVIGYMLTVDIKKRPKVQDILDIIEVKQRINMFGFKNEYEGCKDNILNSIKIPKRYEDVALVLPKIQKYVTDTQLLQINRNDNNNISNKNSNKENSYNMFQFNNPLFKVGKCIIVKNRAISNEQQDNNQYKIHSVIKNGNGILKVNAKLIKINSKEGDNCISLLKETQSTNSSNNSDSNNNNHL